MSLLPRPAWAAEALARGKRILQDPSNAQNGYQLGTGNYHPITLASKPVDVPWTEITDADGNIQTGSDCAGFAICWSYKIPRHRPGFNTGSWASISDDINVDSALEDSVHTQDLFVPVTDSPQPGDLICYPTITLPDHPGLKWIGHVGLINGVSRAIGVDWTNAPRYDLLDIWQCCGGNGRKPAIIATDGSVWAQHDHTWPLPQHRTRMIRLVP